MTKTRDARGRYVTRVQDNVAVHPLRAVLLTAEMAFARMEQGAVLRRMGADAQWAKFHRIIDGEVQTADTAENMVSGEWQRSKTDVASWYSSRFAVVKVRTVTVEVCYE